MKIHSLIATRKKRTTACDDEFFPISGQRGGDRASRRQVDTAETVTLIARKPAAEEETSLVNIEGIKAALLME